jgi:hypothetical protein
MKIAFGVFILLHGLVHLFYFGQSRRLFELRSDMVWPDGSWIFSKLLGNKNTRLLASISSVLATAGFAVGGIGILVSQGWWRQAVVGSAAFSAVIFLLLWDGGLQKLTEKGWIGILINITLLVAGLLLGWPKLGF